MGKERNESCLSQVNLEEESTHASWEGRGKLRALGRCQHHSPGLSLSTKVLFVGLLSCPDHYLGSNSCGCESDSFGPFLIYSYIFRLISYSVFCVVYLLRMGS